MRLTDFIVGNMEVILAKWETFAATRSPAARHMTSLQLRDHAQEILEAVAADLLTTQTPQEQADKSMGLAPAPFPARETAAQTHAILRAKSGFDIRQLASEYRALRASVLSLWMDACLPAPPLMEDVIRFNEANRSGPGRVGRCVTSSASTGMVGGANRVCSSCTISGAVFQVTVNGLHAENTVEISYSVS